MKNSIRATLMLAGSTLALAAGSGAAHAACAPTTNPATGDTVTCSGTSTTAISGGLSENVAVLVQDGATLEVTGSSAISLFSGANITNRGDLPLSFSSKRS
jgi:hypothetical protein